MPLLLLSSTDPHVLKLALPQDSQDMLRAQMQRNSQFPKEFFCSLYWHFNWSPAELGPRNIRSALTHVDVIRCSRVW